MDQESESLLNDLVPSMISNECILANATIIKPNQLTFPIPIFLSSPNSSSFSSNRSGLLVADWLIDSPPSKHTRTKPHNQSSSSSEQQHANNGRMWKKRGGEGAGDAGRAKKKKRVREIESAEPII